MEIESEMKKIKERDIYLCQNNFSKKIIINSLDILNQKISDLSQKFQKFLQAQAATIKRIEDRKYNLSKNNLNRKINTYNEYTINYENMMMKMFC